MRLLYIALCAVSMARLPVQAATIAKMLPLDTLKLLDMPVDNTVESRQIHSADFSSNIPASTSIDVQELPVPGQPPSSVTAKSGHRNSAKFAKRDSTGKASHLSNTGGKPRAFYDSDSSENPDDASLAALRSLILGDIVEKMPAHSRDVSLPSGVNSHIIDPNNIPSFVGFESPPAGVQSVIEKQQALSNMVSRGIELPEFIRPHSINFVARSDGDAGNEDSDEEVVIEEDENTDNNDSEDSGDDEDDNEDDDDNATNGDDSSEEQKDNEDDDSGDA